MRTLPLLAALCGCTGKIATIRVEDTASTTVDAATPLEVLIAEFGFGDLAEMDLTAATELQNQGVGPEDIREVHLESFVLTARSGAADLSFLDAFALSAEAPDVAAVEIAAIDAFPVGEASVAADLVDVDLAPYVLSERMTLTTAVTGRRPAEQTVIDATYVIAVDVTAAGLVDAANE